MEYDRNYSNYDFISCIMITYFIIGIVFALFIEIVIDAIKHELPSDFEWNTYLRVFAVLFWPICSIVFIVGFIKKLNE